MLKISGHGPDSRPAGSGRSIGMSRRNRQSSGRIQKLVDSLLKNKESRCILQDIVSMRSESLSLIKRQHNLESRAIGYELQLCQRFDVKPFDLIPIFIEMSVRTKKSLESSRVSKEYEFFINADFSQYLGQWVAILGNDVVAHSSSLEEIIKTVDELGVKPLYAYVDDKVRI